MMCPGLRFSVEPSGDGELLRAAPQGKSSGANFLTAGIQELQNPLLHKFPGAGTAERRGDGGWPPLRRTYCHCRPV